MAVIVQCITRQLAGSKHVPPLILPVALQPPEQNSANQAQTTCRSGTSAVERGMEVPLPRTQLAGKRPR